MIISWLSSLSVEQGWALVVLALSILVFDRLAKLDEHDRTLRVRGDKKPTSAALALASDPNEDALSQPDALDQPAGNGSATASAVSPRTGIPRPPPLNLAQTDAGASAASPPATAWAAGGNDDWSQMLRSIDVWPDDVQHQKFLRKLLQGDGLLLKRIKVKHDAFGDWTRNLTLQERSLKMDDKCRLYWKRGGLFGVGGRGRETKLPLDLIEVEPELISKPSTQQTPAPTPAPFREGLGGANGIKSQGTPGRAVKKKKAEPVTVLLKLKRREPREKSSLEAPSFSMRSTRTPGTATDGGRPSLARAASYAGTPSRFMPTNLFRSFSNSEGLNGIRSGPGQGAIGDCVKLFRITFASREEAIWFCKNMRHLCRQVKEEFLWVYKVLKEEKKAPADLATVIFEGEDVYTGEGDDDEDSSTADSLLGTETRPNSTPSMPTPIPFASAPGGAFAGGASISILSASAAGRPRDPGIGGGSISSPR